MISVLVILFAGGAAAYYFGIHLPEQDKMAATRAADAEYDLVIQVEAPGWETSTGGSRLPVQVTGEDRDGKKVDEVQYVDSNGEGLKLKQGSYTLAVAASPFTADGGLFEENGTTIDVSFENLKEGEEVDLRKNGGFELMPLDPAETSDDQIDKAYDLASDDDAEGAPDASALRQKAVDLRKDALF